jgi:hypothetical protein
LLAISDGKITVASSATDRGDAYRPTRVASRLICAPQLIDSGSTTWWKPARVKKTGQIKNPEPRFDSIETGLRSLQHHRFGWAILNDAHRVEELADLKLEPVAIAGQRLRCGENLRRGRTGLGSAALDVDDVC